MADEEQLEIFRGPGMTFESAKSVTHPKRIRGGMGRVLIFWSGAEVVELRLEAGIRIQDYEILEPIGEGAASFVYKVRKQDKIFALKIFKEVQGRDRSASLVRFRREVASVARLHHPHIIRIHDFGEFNHFNYIVLEFAEGATLAETLLQGQPTQASAVRIGQALSSALNEIHNFGLIHRDIKPANVIVGANFDVKLIDFGLGGQLEDIQRPGPHRETVGTLLYSSPEQAGVLKRLVDGRSDLYSLGILLYEVLTGHLPFFSQNAGEVIQLHASVKPRPVHEVKTFVSPVLSAIIDKLLQKDPDDRYQSAAGLKFDLDHLTDLEAQHRDAGRFQLASQDVTGGRHFQLPLFGRHEEVQKLKEKLEVSLRGHGQCVLVEGGGGSGKSRIVREVLNESREQRIITLVSKCNPLEMDTPLWALRQMLDQFAEDVESSPLEIKPVLIQKLRSALGASDSIPAMSDGLARLLDIRKSGGNETERDRFMAEVSEFFVRFSRESGGLVLSFDDIQWIDETSRQLFYQLAPRLAQSPLLILATSRNDSASQKNLSAFKKAFEAAETSVLRMGPLSRRDVAELVKAYLGHRPIQEEITTRLEVLSDGNPFVLTEYLSSLLSHGCLRLVDNEWKLEEREGIHVRLSDNVYDLILSRVRSLPVQVQAVLRMASVIGFKFEAGFLCQVIQESESSVRDSLLAAVRSNLIESLEENSFQFVHDRIREALTSSFDETEIKKAHDRVAAVLEKEVREDSIEIFDLAKHCSQGHPGSHPLRLFQSNFAAARLAKASLAGHEAYEFFRSALAAMPLCDLSLEMKFRFFLTFGQACVDLGRLRESYEYFDQALLLSPTGYDRAVTLVEKARGVHGEGRIAECVAMMKQALGEINFHYPTNFWWQWFFILTRFAMIHVLLLRVFLKKEYVIHPNAIKRKTYALASAIHEKLAMLAYFRGEQMEIFVSMQQLYYGLLAGESSELARSMMITCEYISLLRLEKLSGFYHKESYQMAQRLNDPATQVWVECYLPIRAEFLGDCIEGEKQMLKALPLALKKAAVEEITFMHADLTNQYFSRGYDAKAIEIGMSCLQNISETHLYSGGVLACLYVPLIVMGRTSEALEILRKLKPLTEFYSPDLKFHYCRVPAVQFAGMFEQEEFTPEIERWIEEFKSYKYSDIHNTYFYAWIAYIRLAQADRAEDAGTRIESVRKLSRELLTLNLRAQLPMYRCHYHVLRAGLARHRKKFLKAERYLSRASDDARRSDSLIGRFMILKEKARLRTSQSLMDEARLFAKAAHEMAVQNGWVFRAQQVIKEFDLRFDVVPETNFRSLQRTQLQTDSNSRILEALLRVNLATSLEGSSDKQVNAALDEIIKIMGAERGYVFFKNPESALLEFAGGRDAEARNLEAPRGYSSTVIRRVLENQQPLVVTGSDEFEAIGSQSAVIHGLRSIMAVPMFIRNELKGIVYIDSSLAKGLFVADDVQIMTAMASHIVIAFENSRILKLESQKQTMQKDLELGATVQKMLLPKTHSVETASYRMAGYYRSAVQCGGDWWWYDQKNPELLWVFVGDVTGHGVGPAMITTSVATTFKFYQRHGSNLTFPELLRAGSETLLGLTHEEFMMSSIALELDFKAREIRYWNAGSPGFFIFRKKGNVEFFGSVGSLMGSPDFRITEKRASLQAGDRIFIPTDGVLEVDLPNGQMLSTRRVLSMLKKKNDLPLNEALEAFLAELDTARGQAPFEDDLTFVLLEVK